MKTRIAINENGKFIESSNTTSYLIGCEIWNNTKYIPLPRSHRIFSHPKEYKAIVKVIEG